MSSEMWDWTHHSGNLKEKPVDIWGNKNSVRTFCFHWFLAQAQNTASFHSLELFLSKALYRHRCSPLVPNRWKCRAMRMETWGPHCGASWDVCSPGWTYQILFGEASKLEAFRPVSSWTCLLNMQVLDLGNSGFSVIISPECSLSLLKSKHRYFIFWNLYD